LAHAGILNMDERLSQTEILERIRVIQAMIAEGRRATEWWGWVFLLWGTGPLIGMYWETHWPSAALAWPTILTICIVVNGVVSGMRRRRRQTVTLAARSVAAVWLCTGIAVIVWTIAAVSSGTLDLRYVYAAVFAFVAVAHGTSSLILRWLPQVLAALVWLFASLAAFRVPGEQLHDLAAIALVLGNIVFGAWLWYRERRHGDIRDA
jgi:hypothetical protein